ncbi:MAG: DEAD/DEAH box helicase family protein [Cyclobacteriaceae bacterium]
MNQNPEQIARDLIDQELTECGWIVQKKTQINLHAGPGVAVAEYITDAGVADYILFVDQKPVGVIEAKKAEEGHRLTIVEEQSEDYAKSKLKYLDNDPLPFVYESTGELTRFRDDRDPKPRSRPVFTFHRPETLRGWLKQKPLREALPDIPSLPTEGLRDCQIKAINKLESSLKENRPRALVQMATGSGKTFTAITSIYRLLKFANAKRVLFLVDTKNLGEQAEQEFLAYTPNDDNRKFTELYNVQRLKSGYVASDSQVCISTIQRLYSILKGEELDESAEEANPGETKWGQREPVPVAYNSKLPIEFFDFIVIDECHRSIYNLWKQVLDYFDAFLIGLTATPDNRTFGFFNQNVVSEYGYEQAVTDGVLVPYNVYLIETAVSKKGGAVWKGEYVDHRERLSRKKRWAQVDEDKVYSARKLDDEVVNPNQIRTIIKAFKDHLPEIFPGRTEVPKTLIFAKTDSHADDIIGIVREEFAEGNAFCKKITYKADEDPKSVLNQFRNDYNPRIAVTVDMIATGTDVRPLEILLFMRDVKSRNYFEQMKGRGTRTVLLDDLKKVTPSAAYTKDHFVIVDAIGVSKSLKTDSRPLEKKPGVATKDLLNAITVGARDEELFTTLANRLVRLEKQLTQDEKDQFKEQANGKELKDVIKDLLKAYDPDALEEKIREKHPPSIEGYPDEIRHEAQDALIREAASVFTGSLNSYIENVRRLHEQIIDIITPDQVELAGWHEDNKSQAEALINDFKAWLETHKNEISALQIFYNQPYRRRELTYSMIKEVLDKLKLDKPTLAPLRIWQAYDQVTKSKGSPKNELIALVSLVRNISGIDKALMPFDKTVDKNFQDWVFKRQAGALKFTEEQMNWLRMIKDHIASSFHVEMDDLDYTPFDRLGGRGKAWQLFGEGTESIIKELNEELAA